MAANSLLYLLLTTGLTVSPDRSATTESPFGINAEYKTESPDIWKVDHWRSRTKWPGYDDKDRDHTVPWREDTFPTEDLNDPPVTDDVNGYKTDFPNDWRATHRRLREKWSGYDDKDRDHTASWREDTFPTEDISDSPVTDDVNDGYKTESPDDWKAVHWRSRTKWPGYDDKDRDHTVPWREETYTPEDSDGPFTTPPVTDGEDDNAIWRVIGSQSKRERTLPTREWPLVTEDPEHEHHGNWPPATEEPIDGTERPEFIRQAEKKKKRKSCPAREHPTRGKKTCEWTCSDDVKAKCPKFATECACDGGLFRSVEGKCIARDQCPKAALAKDDNSHGCPEYFFCELYCMKNKFKKGRCDGKECKCSNR